jgi:hypothetical protein
MARYTVNWPGRFLLCYIRQVPDKLSDFFAWRVVRANQFIWQDGVGRLNTHLKHYFCFYKSKHGTQFRASGGFLQLILSSF